MSTLGVSSSQSLSSYYTSLASQDLNASSAASSLSPSALSLSSASLTSSGLSTSGVHRHHHHGGGGGDKFKQLQSAVTSALQQAQADGDDSDPNSVVDSAIAKVLQGFASGSQSTDSTGASQDTDADASTDASSSTDGAQSFAQTLQSFGIDPQQFHQDFLTAVQNAQNGSADPSTAFQSLPVGSVVDELA